MGELVGARLNEAAMAEAYPRLIPLALRAWGAEDTTFVSALRAAVAVAGSGVRGAKTCALVGAVEIDPKPDWGRDDAVLEWGILNPFGPTKVQFCLVPIGAETRALVYTLHNPFGPVCLLLGVIEGDADSHVRQLLLDLADRFELGEHVLLKALPHWVLVSAESGLRGGEGAAFFRTLHLAAIARDMAADCDVDVVMRDLQALRLNPQQEVHRQSVEAMETTRLILAGVERSGESATFNAKRAKRGAVSGSTADDYERWFQTASSPEHTAAVARHFLDCWNAALRFQRSADDE
jgi:hypothetical protein